MNAQLPEGSVITPGTPLSVANVEITPEAPEPNVRLTV